MASFAVARYHSNGELDNTFGDSGKLIVTFDNSLESARTLVISTGRNDSVTVCGNLGKSTIGIARITSAGVLDRTFGNEGKIVTQFMEGQSEPIIRSIFFAQTNSFPTPITLGLSVEEPNNISPQGLSIMAMGEVGRFNNPKFGAIARYNVQGQLDKNFGTDGTTLINFQVNQLQVKAGAYSSRQSKVILVAESRINQSNTIALQIARLLPNGTLDTSFGTDGRILALFALEGDPSSIPIDSYDAVIRSNDILIAGSGRRQTEDLIQLAVVSVNDIGSNTQFGNRGVALAQFGRNSVAKSVIIDARGRILAVGGNINSFVLARFLRMGRLDNTFGQGGKVTTQFIVGKSEINIIKIDSPVQERIVAAGVDGQHFALARYLENGTLDHSFGDRGRIRTVIGNEKLFSRVLDIAFDSQNRIVAAGPFDPQGPIR